MIEAKIIEDSLAPNGKRLTTLQLVYPRFIHSELMTHRVFSRNASSSRAIPVAKMIQQVRAEAAKPIHWGLNQPGMQASEEAPLPVKVQAMRFWQFAAEDACRHAEAMMALGIAKQVTNRLLEPFQHMHVVVTATEWHNFFELRCHPDAQPEFQELAHQMRGAMQNSEPVLRRNGDLSADSWHLPYVSAEERDRYSNQPILLAKISAARCARVSYLNHDGTDPDMEKDNDLFYRLVGQRPMHASPIEHQAHPNYGAMAQSRNFRGWVQFREQWENEVYA